MKMCGIAGVINKKGKKVQKEIVKQMCETIAHRGPDAEGIFLKENIGLGHRRLSILDLTADGNQPMYSHDEKYVIVYNGEIYNYLELKKKLSREGAVFQNETDTEVILEAYRYWGPDCTKRFNGMWSFALFDIEKNTLLLSRDRFGVKPLYLFETDSVFMFASEIKCITAVYPEEKVVDVLQIARHMRGIQEDGDEHTFYKNIVNFPKSKNMIYDLNNNTRKIYFYWQINAEKCKRKWGGKNPCKRFRALMEDAIRIRLRSDVPVGASLSGGLDSSTIVGIAGKKFNIKMNTFSSIYEEKKYNEKVFIDNVNKFVKANANMIYPDQNGSVLSDLKRLIYFHDGPCCCISPYSGFCVYRGVGNKVKVLLDGQGADELFCGYEFFYREKLKDLLERETIWSRFQAVKLIADFQSTWPEKFVFPSEILIRILGVKGYHYYTKKYGKYRQNEVWDSPELFTDKLLEVDLQNKYPINTTLRTHLEIESFKQMEYIMLPRILHDVDRNSMAYSLEVRLPFLDYRLVEFAYSLDGDYKIHNTWTKYLIRKSMKKYLPRKVRLRRNKMGFPAPFDKWLKDERYRVEIKTYLDNFKNRGIVKGDKLEKCYQEHIEGKFDWSQILFRAMILEMWLQMEIDTEKLKWNMN